MNISVFQQATYYKQSFFQKLFKQFPEENAVVELNNLLATKEIQSITPNDIQKIEHKYGLNLHKEFALNLEEFYAVYLNSCLLDNVLSDNEVDDLRHLKSLLGLNDVVINKLHDKIGGAIYEANFKEVIKDGRLGKKEKSFIEKLQNDLRLDESLANKISEEVRGAYLNNFIKRAIADDMLSPEEEKELDLICKSLNVKLDLDQKTKDHFKKIKLFWIIENGELPICKVDINLQKNEVCYYTDFIEWEELRRGSWTVIDRGNVFFTNKRILFMGESKNTNIRLEKILSCTIHAHGVEVDKDAGKVPILIPRKDIDIMGRILKRLIR